MSAAFPWLGAPALMPGARAVAAPAFEQFSNGVVDRTRPLCPYPQVALYKGSGSTDDAANFVCGAR